MHLAQDNDVVYTLTRLEAGPLSQGFTARSLKQACQ